MIIAEIGSNFDGNIKLAYKLIKEAKENNADLVKLQLYSTKNLQRTPETLVALRKSELSKNLATDLFNYGNDIGVEVFFSVFFPEAVEWCESMGVKRYKLAARQDINDKTSVLVQETKKPVIVSVAPNYNREKGWANPFYNIDVLYCLSKYPTPLESLRFNNIDFIFEYQGFSDHTIGLDAAKIAIARGASIIEKHFAIDHKTGVDSAWSMTPSELKELKNWEDKVNMVK